MTYFQKKQRPSNTTFTNQIDESSMSGYLQEGLAINNNIFNKMANSNQIQRNQYTQNQNNQSKDSCTISYLKNYKKNNSKTNQQNIQFGEPVKHALSNNNNQSSLNKQYEAMMTKIIRGPNNDNKSTVRQNIMNKNMNRNKDGNVQKDQKDNRQNTFQNHSFLNDHDEQSMQQMLNSSINQFERFLQHQKEHDFANTALYEQNVGLKKTLSKLKSILKQKLQHGLKKQKQEMKDMLNQYIQLITKLLHDKEQLSAHIENLEEQIFLKSNQVIRLQKKVQGINNQKDQHIEKTKQQINQFMMVIQQFQNQAKQENSKFEQMEKQLQRLRPFENQMKQLEYKPLLSTKKYSASELEEQQKRIQIQSQKLQTLLQLLQGSQRQQNRLKGILTKQNIEIMSLRNQISQSANYKSQSLRPSYGQSQKDQLDHQQFDEIKVFYEQKLQEIQIEHEQEFIEYQKAIKQTIKKKDECIERLNYIISQLRQGKKSGIRSSSIDDVKEKTNKRNQVSTFTQQNILKKPQQHLSISKNTFNYQQYGKGQQHSGY